MSLLKTIQLWVVQVVQSGSSGSNCDTDEDGNLNINDLDSDEDGCPDADEGYPDAYDASVQTNCANCSTGSDAPVLQFD